MKLESLNAAKFENFKQFKIDNPLEITGGLREKTTWVTISGGHVGDRGGDTRLTGADNNTGVTYPSGNRAVRGSSGADIIPDGIIGRPQTLPDTIAISTGENIGKYTPFSGSSYIGQLNSNDDRYLISLSNSRDVERIINYVD